MLQTEAVKFKLNLLDLICLNINLKINVIKIPSFKTSIVDEIQRDTDRAKDSIEIYYLIIRRYICYVLSFQNS